MDLMSLNNSLKNLSDQQLAGVAHTSPEIPPFLLVAEMQRRSEMRKEYAAATSKQPSQQTVAERLMGQFQAAPGQAPQAGGGIAALPQQAPQPSPGMAAGGIVSLAHYKGGGYLGGGEMDQPGATQEDQAPKPAPALDPQQAPIGLRPAMTPEEFMRRYPQPKYSDAMREVQAQQGPDQLAPLSVELARLYAQDRSAKVNPMEALSQAGFAMAAAPTHSFGMALGEGGLKAVANIQAQKDQHRVNLMQTLQHRIGLAEHQQAAQQHQEQLGAAVMGRDAGYTNTMMNELEPNLRKDYDPEIDARMKRIKELDPSVSDAKARVTAIQQKAAEGQKMLIEQKRQEGLNQRLESKPVQLPADISAALIEIGAVDPQNPTGSEMATARKRVQDDRIRVSLASRSPAQPRVADDTREALEDTARSLAAGDLSRLRDIASLRGDQRIRLYAMVKKLDPTFNTALVDRKIKMEDYYANGKGADNLRSFGIFLEHGGDASDAVNQIRLTQSKIINKPINWWRENASGSPEYQNLITSLEPVRKEFEKFLLGGQALYTDDRKAANIILSDDSSPAQIQQALKTMGRTAKARYTEENHRYKKVMGHDLQDVFSPEAQEGSKKIGIPLEGVPLSRPQADVPSATGTGAADAVWGRDASGNPVRLK